MCNCITRIKDKIKGREVKRSKVISAEIVEIAIMGPNYNLQTHSTLECIVEGKKKTVKQNLLHAYCPFCGEKYPEQQ